MPCSTHFGSEWDVNDGTLVFATAVFVRLCVELQESGDARIEREFEPDAHRAGVSSRGTLVSFLHKVKNVLCCAGHAFD